MADLFDIAIASANTTCSILGRVAGAQDAAGLTPRTTSVLEAGVPCQVSRISVEELKGQKEFSKSTHKIYMRPWAISGSTVSHPANLAAATGQTELNSDMEILVGNFKFNIEGVQNPRFAYHHFEIWAYIQG